MVLTMKRHQKYTWLLPLLLIIITANLGFDLCCYQNYQDKMSILEQMMQADDSAELDTAIAILKTEKPENTLSMLEQSEKLLEQYGYAENFENRYYVSFFKQCMVAAAVSLFFLLTAAAIIWGREKRWHMTQEIYFRQLAQSLLEFREGKNAGYDFPSMKGNETASGRVSGQLEMLADYLSLVKEQAQEEKEKTKEMVTDISHQLKTPVAALDTCFTVLEDTSLNEAERKEFYFRCRNELEGLKTLLDSLIQISRLEAGMIIIERKQAPILDTVLTAVNRIYPKASARQTEIVCDYEPEIEQLTVMQDEKWLCEALINVLDNAVKYSPAGSEIQIGIQRMVQFVRVEITDQGIGIPKKEYHKVFKRFYRGGSKWVQEENGSGVGLYLTREIISEHHGNVSVRSGNGRDREYPGSIFMIYLPLV